MKAHLLRHVDNETLRRMVEDDVDENGTLREGGRLRVPMSMMDAVPRPKLAKLDDGLFPPEHRVGYRVNKSSLTDEAKAKRAALYDSYDQEISTAYLQDDYGAQGRGSKEGDPCTCRNVDYPLDVGSPGHLKMVRGELTCVPDNPRGATDAKRRRKTQLRDPEGREQGTEEAEEDLQDARSIRDAEYRRYEDDLVNAWKQPIHDHTPVNNPKRRPAGVILHDTRESAIADYNAELENAWRGK